MKLILTAFVTLLFVISVADALNASVYGSPATKIDDLKAGSGLIVMARGGNSSSGFGDATSANVKKAGVFSSEYKQMSVNKTAFIGRDGARNSYRASPVTKLK